MKNYTLLLISVLTLFFSSCTITKKSDGAGSLYNTTWELEYISGSRIAFDGLYPNKKPQIIFDNKTSEVTGNAGCNGYGAKFTLEKSFISFGEPNPSTMMYCDGAGEQVFLQTIKKIDGYSIDIDHKLILKIGDIPVMRFKKSAE